MEEAPELASTHAADRRNARVLVVDDERLVREIAAYMLQLGGYDVVTAAHGAEALEQGASAEREGRPIGIAILDVTVPGTMGGAETFGLMRDRHPLIDVVLSSGYGPEDWLQAEHPPAAVLPKPYHRHELLACVATLARQKERFLPA